MKYYSTFKKSEVTPLAATWIDLEMIILSDVRQRKTNITWYHVCEIWKNDTNELIYKTDRPTDVENKLMVPKEERGRGIN